MICTKCKQPKVVDEMAKDATWTSGYKSTCKLCLTLKARNNAAKDPDRYRQYQLNRYGIKLEDFNENLEAQGNRCLICKDPFTKTLPPSIDHDHNCCPGIKSCGKCVRGLICRPCNVAIGSFKEDLNVIKNAVLYLEGGSKFFVKTTSSAVI